LLRGGCGRRGREGGGFLADEEAVGGQHK
jgi:hypothetical protein